MAITRRPEQPNHHCVVSVYNEARAFRQATRRLNFDTQNQEPWFRVSSQEFSFSLDLFGDAFPRGEESLGLTLEDC